jgi:hypothetical protein
MKARAVVVLSFALLACGALLVAQGNPGGPAFSSERDLLSLHYDHAPDKDDGHSAAADRTILQALHDVAWIKAHVVAVSGAYGLNAAEFNPESDKVMEAVWGEYGGWLDAHRDREQAIAKLVERWDRVLTAGGGVWVKEGGQSDVTAEVVRRLRARRPTLDPKRSIHVVQHSRWNEDQTTPSALEYTKQNCDYIRIRDANQYLNVKGGNAAFVAAARQHPVLGRAWTAAFAYYPPEERLDFSDTGELMHILGLGEMGVDAFRERFLGR